MQQISSLAEIAGQFDAFLCDLWGVIHDGEYLYPGVLEALEALQGAGKQVMFLSNAPRSAESVIQKMKQMGVRREWYLGALTSGEAARRYLEDIHRYAVEGNRFLKGKYFYQGLESDAAMLEGLPQPRVASVEEADFILNGNFDYHGQPLAEIMPRLQAAASRQLPMLCINPDWEVVKQDGTQILCAGYLAAEYEKLGGQVGYIGKPYPLVYEMAMSELYLCHWESSKLPQVISGEGAVPLEYPHPSCVAPRPLPEAEVIKNRIAMIGDNLFTDIKGGKAAGIATILVTQGVHNGADSAEGIAPDYVLPSLRWEWG